MIWREEHVPARMAEGVAIMIFKNKGSSNDTSQYRAIMLLQVTWKVLSSYLLKRVMADVKDYLPKTQTAYQAKKSTDQNIYVLAEAIDSVLAVAKECTISFVDFSAAFDSTSQVFLTEALLEAGASHKCVAIFRVPAWSMYSITHFLYASRLKTRVQFLDGGNEIWDELVVS